MPTEPYGLAGCEPELTRYKALYNMFSAAGTITPDQTIQG